MPEIADFLYDDAIIVFKLSSRFIVGRSSVKAQSRLMCKSAFPGSSSSTPSMSIENVPAGLAI